MKELTAKQDRCGDSLVCPAVFETGSKLVIIGKLVEPGILTSRVGIGETVIEIERGIVERALSYNEG